MANAAASVVQSTQYYPFGSSFADASGTSTQPYKYNGKELDARNGLNMYDYSARWKADWFFPTVDPLAEKYYSISPYAYCNNNPIKFIDPTGMAPDTARVYTETINYGHAWISVGEGDNMVVYSYDPNTPPNRNRIKGHPIRGKGQLTKYVGTYAQKYLEEKKKKTDMESVLITDVSECTIEEVIESYIAKGQKMRKDFYDYRTEIVDREEVHIVTGINEAYDVGDSYGSYNALTNNCTTFVSDVLNKSGSDALTTMKTTKTITNRIHGDIYTVPIIVKGRYVLPSSLRSKLNK